MKIALVNQYGVVTNMIVLDTGAKWTPPDGTTAIDGEGGAVGDMWDGEKFVAPLPPQVETIPKTVFDGADFLLRLTLDEYEAIIDAAKTNIKLARWLDIFRLRGIIDVTGSTALDAKDGLIEAGLLSQERADEIFATE